MATPKTPSAADAAPKAETKVTTQTVVEDFTDAPAHDAYGNEVRVEKSAPDARGTVVENYF